MADSSVEDTLAVSMETFLSALKNNEERAQHILQDSKNSVDPVGKCNFYMYLFSFEFSSNLPTFLRKLTSFE